MLALFSLPKPLHPAVVHFPIVLLLLGAVVAMIAACRPRWGLPGIAAALLVLGAFGAAVAAQSGESGNSRFKATPAIAQLLERHEGWAERTQIAAVFAALLASGTVVASRRPAAARALGIAAAAGALAASWCVIETGHNGGQLVYGQGAGAIISAANNTDSSSGAASPEPKKQRKDDND